MFHIYNQFTDNIKFINIRDVSNCIFNQIIQLDNKDFCLPWKSNIWHDLKKERDYFGCYIVEGENIISFALFKVIKADDLGHLLKIVVAKEYRNRGLGKSLLNNSIESFKRNGISSIYLEVDINNEIAISFYENFGFHKLANIKDLYRSGEDGYSYKLDFLCAEQLNVYNSLLCILYLITIAFMNNS